MKHVLTLVSAITIASTASAQVFATDDFSYTGALTSNGWTAHSGAGNKILSADGSVATIDFSGGSGEDVNLLFTNGAIGANDDVYASFTLNVPSGNPVNPDSSGSYCVHFKDSGFGFRGRFGLLSPAGTGDFQVAISTSSSNLGNGGIWASDLSFDTNYTIVISYDVATGESKLWVDPTSASSTSVSNTGSSGSLIDSIALRQGSDHTGFITVDDLVAGNSFSDVLAAAPGAATTESFGTGCYTSYSSIYDLQNAGADDLAGYKISGTPNGSGGFDISVTPGSGFAAPLGSQAVTLGDDDEFDTSLLPNPGTLGMWIGSNGWMATGGGNSTGFSPSVSTLLNNPNTAVYAWTDLQPDAAGSVFYREFNGVATAIFLDVPGWNQPTELNSIKIDIDTNTGGWSVEIDEVGAGNPEDMLVGYSVGGASLDPGASDFVFGGFATSVPVHEMMPAGPHDLVGQRLTGVQDGVGGIIVTRTPGAGFGVPLGSQLLAGIGDDDVFDVSTIGGSLGMFIGSNGWMADAPGNSTGFAPSVATMENNPSLAIYAWTDLQPDANEAAGIGGLYYVENGTVATAIYDGIWGWNTQDENDILISCDVSNGSWAMEFGNIGAGNPEDMLVAYNNPPAAAGPSTAVDWTVVTTGAPLGPIGAADQAGLALTSNNPSLGTSWDMTCSDMEAGAQGAFFFFGSSAINPGIDLGVIGAPGCFAYTSNDLPSTLVLGSGSVTTSIAIPNNPALAGAQLTVQAASTSSQNAFGAATSNGLTGTVGL